MAGNRLGGGGHCVSAAEIIVGLLMGRLQRANDYTVKHIDLLRVVRYNTPSTGEGEGHT